MLGLKLGWSKLATVLSVILGISAVTTGIIKWDARYAKASDFEVFKIGSYEYRINQRIKWLNDEIRRLQYTYGQTPDPRRMTENDRNYWYWLLDELAKARTDLQKLYRGK